MKKHLFIAAFILATIAEIIALIVFALQTPDFSQDTVAVNEVLQSVTQNFNNLGEHETATSLDYAVLDKDGNILYKTKSGLSESLNAAIAHRDTVLDITVNDSLVGKVIVYNDGALSLQ